MSITGAIAVSGLNAASLRLQVSASNVANAISDGPLPGSPKAATFPRAYAPLRLEKTEAAGSGTLARIGTVSPGYVAAFDPAAPYADATGLVARPNVDLASELIQQLMGRFALTANAQVLRAAAQMTATLLDITI
jgi:flagellar basal-body rod protein FlgC